MNSFVRAILALLAVAVFSGNAEAVVRKCTVPENLATVAVLNGRVIAYYPAPPPASPPPLKWSPWLGIYARPGSLEIYQKTVTARDFVREQSGNKPVSPASNPEPLPSPEPPESNPELAPTVPSPFEGIDSKDIVAVSVGCLEVMENGVPVRRPSVSIITREGAPELLNRYLAELVAEQDIYRRASGTFAATLDDLRFFASRHEIPIEMTSSSNGWTASARVSGVDTACSVSVGGSQSRRVVCSES